MERIAAINAIESIRRLSEFNQYYAAAQAAKVPGNCPRTFALYHPGQHLPGVDHHYQWTGKIPCTGRRVCYLCGKEKP